MFKYRLIPDSLNAKSVGSIGHASRQVLQIQHKSNWYGNSLNLHQALQVEERRDYWKAKNTAILYPNESMCLIVDGMESKYNNGAEVATGGKRN